MDEINVIETHANGTPALWTEEDALGGVVLCDDNQSVSVENASQLEYLIAEWRRCVG